MSLRMILRPEAFQDLLEVRNWYELQRQGLGSEFLDEAEAALDRLRERPEMYAVVLHDIRRLKLHRFPYVIYYRVTDHHIAVLAVMHGSRDADSWQSRLP